MFHNFTLLPFIILFALTSQLQSKHALASESTFVKISLPHGITIEIPAHWAILSEAERNNLSASSEAQALNQGIRASDAIDTAERLLAVSSLPNPSGAKIRISVAPPSFTAGNLSASVASDFIYYKNQFLNENKITGVNILQMETPRIEQISNTTSLVVEYTRADKYSLSPWRVIQYTIPLQDKHILFTTSYRESDAYKWKPIILYSKNTLRITK